MVYPNGNKVFYLAQGNATQGTFGLYRWEFAGPASGPGAHFHRTITESFYVLEGTLDFHVAQNNATVFGSGSHDKTGRHCLATDPTGKLDIVKHAGYWLRDEGGRRAPCRC